MSYSVLNKRKSIRNALKQIWLDEFNEACKAAYKHADENNLRRVSKEHQARVNFCRDMYQSHTIYHKVYDKHRNYDRYCNGLRKNL